MTSERSWMAPRYQALVSADPATPAAYRSQDTIDFNLQLLPESVWENTVTIRSTQWARMYEPGVWISRVSPTPLLLVVALGDTTTPTDLALAAYDRGLDPKKLVLIPGGHCDRNRDRFDTAVSAAAT